MFSASSFSKNIAAGFPRRRTCPFTLIELLVVIAIIAILASMLMPALGAARSRGRAATCTNNQKHIGMALLIYTSDNDSYLMTSSDRSRTWDDKVVNILNNQTGSHSIKDSKVMLCPELFSMGFGEKANANTAVQAYTTTYSFNADLITTTTGDAFKTSRLRRPGRSGVIGCARPVGNVSAGLKWVAYFYNLQGIQFFDGSGRFYTANLALGAVHGGERMGDICTGRCNVLYADGHSSSFAANEARQNGYYAPLAYHNQSGINADLWE